MAKKTDKFFSIRDRLFEEVPKDMMPESIDEAVRLSGLDWTIEPKPVYYLANPEAEEDDTLPMEVVAVEQHFANVRSDNGHALGIVTKRYVSFDNIDAFSFLSEVFGSEMDFAGAGEFDGGKRVFVVMQIPDFIEVGGDKIGQYAFIHTSHDGKHAISVGMTPLRWVSQTLVTADLRHQRGQDRFIAIRHSNQVEKKIEEAQRMLELTTNYYKQFKVLGDKLASKRVKNADLVAFTQAILPIDEEQGERHARNVEEARGVVQNIFLGRGEFGDSQGNSPGTWWALYNAAVEYVDYYVPLRKNGNQLKRMLDDPSSFKTNAFDLALGGAGL